MNYTDEELKRLHSCLYDILREIRRVCDILQIKFVMLGGSAIGVYYWKGIVPYDDDIDIGMLRSDYDLFLRKAPSLLRDDFFLQWPGSEEHTPVFFAKLRRKGTLFVEEPYRNLNINHGVFVDIMPLDSIPNSRFLRWTQRKLANIVNDCFVAKELWRYRWMGRCEVDHPVQASYFNCLMIWCLSRLFNKTILYRLLHFIQTFFDRRKTNYYNTIPAYLDFIPTADLEQLQEVLFGDIRVWVPNNLDTYLHLHYPILKKHLSSEEIQKYIHRPVIIEIPQLHAIND